MAQKVRKHSSARTRDPTCTKCAHTFPLSPIVFNSPALRGLSSPDPGYNDSGYCSDPSIHKYSRSTVTIKNNEFTHNTETHTHTSLLLQLHHGEEGKKSLILHRRKSNGCSGELRQRLHCHGDFFRKTLWGRPSLSSPSKALLDHERTIATTA